MVDKSTITVDLKFPLVSLEGQPLPLDNGYLIYSALSRICRSIHEIPNLSIHPIPGIADSKNQLHLQPQSYLTIRLSHPQIPLIYNKLAGQSLRIGKNKYDLGIPVTRPLESPSSLYSRLVIIRRRQDPDSFESVAKQQLQNLGIQGNLQLLSRQDGRPQQRQLTIQNRQGTFKLRGFGVRVDNLTEDESLILQEHGLGGKQKMMCGVFVPSKTQK